MSATPSQITEDDFVKPSKVDMEESKTETANQKKRRKKKEKRQQQAAAAEKESDEEEVINQAVMENQKPSLFTKLPLNLDYSKWWLFEDYINGKDEYG